jgi:hypothetical protein
LVPPASPRVHGGRRLIRPAAAAAATHSRPAAADAGAHSRASPRPGCPSQQPGPSPRARAPQPRPCFPGKIAQTKTAVNASGRCEGLLLALGGRARQPGPGAAQQAQRGGLRAGQYSRGALVSAMRRGCGRPAAAACGGCWAQLPPRAATKSQEGSTNARQQRWPSCATR